MRVIRRPNTPRSMKSVRGGRGKLSMKRWLRMNKNEVAYIKDEGASTIDAYQANHFPEIEGFYEKYMVENGNDGNNNDSQNFGFNELEKNKNKKNKIIWHTIQRKFSSAFGKFNNCRDETPSTIGCKKLSHMRVLLRDFFASFPLTEAVVNGSIMNEVFSELTVSQGSADNVNNDLKIGDILENMRIMKWLFILIDPNITLGRITTIFYLTHEYVKVCLSKIQKKKAKPFLESLENSYIIIAQTLKRKRENQSDNVLF